MDINQESKLHLNFIEVIDQNHVREVARLANKIWIEYFAKIISKQQIDYMLTNMQSAGVIQKQIEDENHRYYLIENQENKYAGYLGFSLNEQELFLSKFYLTLESRGLGCGTEMMFFLESHAQAQGCKKITLRANKKNLNAISFYERMGFSKVESICEDIGSGFVMDDYKMEKMLS